ncbi:hypothetical protein BDW59DRAFT_145764 [Aspergillus cavernicola]|uniref:Lytic polysaccharide monooxygenase n=1 Tax=Aspergillus cavernicola TaxID=176166 RepID=A0ABR4IE42_9EURO
MFFKSTVTAFAMLGASLVDAHAIMIDPVPYNFQSWDNSPLDASGSNFPCKSTDYTVTQENHMAVGETQKLAFQGGATHGGGSCQISITSDRAPTKDTEWSVIMSIESGCMDVNEIDDNIGDTASMKTPFSPEFTIPDSFEPGQYTLAWTWFNRIGNREMYMNCAPVTLSGGSSSKRSEVAVIEKRAEEYPPLFIANINGCQTRHNYDVRFPNPGSNLEQLGPVAHLIGVDEDPCAEGAPTWGDAGFSSGGSDSAPQPTASESASEPASTSTEEPTSSISVGVTVAVPNFTPAPTQPSETTQSSESTAILPTSTLVESTAPAPTSLSEPGSPSTSGALSGPCTEEGTWHCISGSSFQRCASGTWTPAQALAGGTECTSGQSQDFNVKAISVKSRMLKQKRSHRRSYGAHAKIHS